VRAVRRQDSSWSDEVAAGEATSPGARPPERDYISKKLEEAKVNVTRAAELLGLERSHLYRKMKALGIAPKE